MTDDDFGASDIFPYDWDEEGKTELIRFEKPLNDEELSYLAIICNRKFKQGKAQVLKDFKDELIKLNFDTNSFIIQLLDIEISKIKQ